MKKPKLSKFELDCNRIRALISFHKIKTIEEACKELGIDCIVDPTTLVSPQIFNEYLKTFQAYKEESNIPLWNNEDAIIESQVYAGISKDEVRIHSTSDAYYDKLREIIPPRNERQQATCLYFQENNALEVYNAIVKEHKKALYIRANTGDGKTYAVAQIIRWLLDSKYLEGKTISPWKILYVTGPSIIDQTEEVLGIDSFGIELGMEVQVINYEALRSKFGNSRYIQKKFIIEQGEEQEIWEWIPNLHPSVIIWDEGHKLKNEGSTQSKIAQACNNIDYINPFTQKPAEIIQIFASASPFSRILHAKAFAVATGHEYKGRDGRKIKITNKNWRHIAQEISGNTDLQLFSRKAIRSFLREFKDYIYPFKNVRRKHKAILGIEILNFTNDEDRQKYKTAWERFEEIKRKLEGMDYSNSQFLILVQLMIFRQAAEIIRAYELACKMYRAWQNGFAPVAACCFKPTIAKAVLILINDFGIKRNQISIIWGGNQAFAGTKEKLSKEAIMDTLTRAMKDPESVSLKTVKAIHQQLLAESEGLGEIPKELRLGVQSKEQRNEERKRFQQGESTFCFFTFGAGKEGLSLHQNVETLRPRRQFNTPTYNEMEMLQAEGRTARITSCTDTEITTLVYEDTIEVPVLQRVMQKRKCLDVVLSHGTNRQTKSYDETIDKILGLMSSSEEDEDIEESAFEQIQDEAYGDKKDEEDKDDK